MGPTAGARKGQRAAYWRQRASGSMGVSYETLNRWKQNGGGTTVPEAKDKKRLEDDGFGSECE